MKILFNLAPAKNYITAAAPLGVMQGGGWEGQSNHHSAAPQAELRTERAAATVKRIGLLSKSRATILISETYGP